MSRHNTSEPTSSISLSQVAASALAASSAAFAASYLGVAGTIIGAAVASVIATVASATYHSSLKRSSAAVRRTAGLVRPVPLAPSETVAQPVRSPSAWRGTALAAAAVLGITLAGLTSLETALGKPLSALLGGSDAAGTSLGSAVGTGSSNSRTTTKAD